LFRLMPLVWSSPAPQLIGRPRKRTISAREVDHGLLASECVGSPRGPRRECVGISAGSQRAPRTVSPYAMITYGSTCRTLEGNGCPSDSSDTEGDPIHDPDRIIAAVKAVPSVRFHRLARPGLTLQTRQRHVLDDAAAHQQEHYQHRHHAHHRARHQLAGVVAEGELECG
jgi:hypothetical protein